MPVSQQLVDDLLEDLEQEWRKAEASEKSQKLATWYGSYDDGSGKVKLSMDDEQRLGALLDAARNDSLEDAALICFEVAKHSPVSAGRLLEAAHIIRQLKVRRGK